MLDWLRTWVASLYKLDDKMEKLIFVYNANSGLFNTVSDYAHKIFSPKTYECNLCKLSYGNLGMKNKWKKFVNDLPMELEFLHKDEYVKTFPDRKDQLPCILKDMSDNITLMANADEMNKCTTLQQLMELINIKLKN